MGIERFVAILEFGARIVSCPFCYFSEERTFYQGHLCKALWDAFPASVGHALLIPNRHVSKWFDATPEEQMELLSGISVAREIIDKLHSPDGYNIGVNIGEAAGQTVPHLHVHLIPR